MKNVSEEKKGLNLTQRIVDIVQTFFGASESSDLVKKGGLAVTGRVIYYFADYGLLAFTAAFVGFLRYYNWRIFEIFVLLWAGNIVVSWVIIWINRRLRIDFTFCEGYSRLATRIAQNRSSVRYAIAVPLVPLIFWYGPGPLIIFLQTGRKFAEWTLAVILVSASGLQMIVWTWIYVMGYEGFSHLVRF